MTAPRPRREWTRDRAVRSAGTSETAIHRMVARALDDAGATGAVFVDVGCGTGALREVVRGRFREYRGVDVVRFPDFPRDATFVAADLESGTTPLPDGCADVAAAVEVIEHVENPRALVRELSRLARPGGWVLVSTPNQLSWLSIGTLIAKHQFTAFQDGSYPAHLTALLEIDLLRMAAECGLVDARTRFSGSGRMPLTGAHWPGVLPRLFPRRFSDTILLMARKAA